MNNKLKVFLKEFLGFGFLAVIFTTLMLYPVGFLFNYVDFIDNLNGFAPIFISALIAAYILVKILKLSSRSRIFYRVVFWFYLVYLTAFSNIFIHLISGWLKGGKLANATPLNVFFTIFSPIVIIGAIIIPFLVIPPRRKSNRQTEEAN